MSNIERLPKSDGKPFPECPRCARLEAEVKELRVILLAAYKDQHVDGLSAKDEVVLWTRIQTYLRARGLLGEGK